MTLTTAERKGVTREVLAVAGLVLVHALVALFVVATIAGTPGFDETARNLAVLAAAADIGGMTYFFGQKNPSG